jgi:peptide-methionine (S)-S-oxide reductase
MTQTPEKKSLETATLGGGCFWCLEAVFEQLIGVEKVESGYAGGHVEDPTYKQVCTATTGHAEIVQIAFDPSVITYRELLEVFFAIHDPTTLNRQGADIGPQYRSAIFTHDDAQREVATRLIAELGEAGAWPRPIVTEVAPLARFYKAEEYHQGYFRGNAGQGYCQAVVAPKVLKSREKFARLMRK